MRVQKAQLVETHDWVWLGNMYHVSDNCNQAANHDIVSEKEKDCTNIQPVSIATYFILLIGAKWNQMFVSGHSVQKLNSCTHDQGLCFHCHREHVFINMAKIEKKR